MLARLSLVAAISFLSSSNVGFAVDGFTLNSLPVGADVTLPGPAITFVPLAERVKLSSTDTPQTIKLSTVNVKRKSQVVPLKVTIYDSKNVKFITLKPGASYMYSFSKVGSISLVSERPNGTGDSSQYQLRIESDKPLNIAR